MILPPLLSINILASGKFFETRKTLILLPSYPQTFSLPEILGNAAQKGWSTKYFGTVKQKYFDGKTYIPPLLCLTIFDTRNWWNTKGFPYKIFRPCETKKFRQKTENGDTPPPSYPKIFRYRKFSETQHGMVPPRKFWHCETKNFRRKFLILPPPSPPCP